VPTFALAEAVTGQGSITATPNLPRYVSGTVVTLDATTGGGWRFLRWQGDACGTSAGADVVVDVNKAVTAVFEAIPGYPLTATTAGEGRSRGIRETIFRRHGGQSDRATSAGLAVRGLAGGRKRAGSELA